MERLNLALIESRWWEDGNDSVRGAFDTLAGILVNNPFGYHYEMFSTADSIREMIPRIARTKDIHHLHIAAHGDEKFILGAGESKISWATLADNLAQIDARQLYGVFIGSCRFGENVEALMDRTGLTWLVGYDEDVDWVHALTMDLYFWHAYYQTEASEARRKEDRARIMPAFLMALHIRVPYLFNELGFRVRFSDGRQRLTFPECFMAGERDPLDEYDDLFTGVLKFINDSKPGTWPTLRDLGD